MSEFIFKILARKSTEFAISFVFKSVNAFIRF